MPSSPARMPCAIAVARREGGHVARAQRLLARRLPGLAAVVQSSHAPAAEHDEELLLGRVGVRRIAHHARARPRRSRGRWLTLPAAVPRSRSRKPASPCSCRTGSTSWRLTMVEGRGLGRRDRQVARRRLPRPRVRLGRRRDPGGAVPGDAGARQSRQSRGSTRAEGEHVELLLAGDEGVRRAAGEVHEAIAGAHRDRLPVLPAHAGPGEHEEDLLLALVGVHGRRAPAGVHLHVTQAGRDAAGGVAEVAPHAGQRTDLDASSGDVVPVDERRRGHGAPFRRRRGPRHGPRAAPCSAVQVVAGLRRRRHPPRPAAARSWTAARTRPGPALAARPADRRAAAHASASGVGSSRRRSGASGAGGGRWSAQARPAARRPQARRGGAGAVGSRRGGRPAEAAARTRAPGARRRSAPRAPADRRVPAGGAGGAGG